MYGTNAARRAANFLNDVFIHELNIRLFGYSISQRAHFSHAARGRNYIFQFRMALDGFPSQSGLQSVSKYLPTIGNLGEIVTDIRGKKLHGIRDLGKMLSIAQSLGNNKTLDHSRKLVVHNPIHDVNAFQWWVFRLQTSSL